ncbi:MAG: TerB family tellurite resistance protein [Rhodospirillales bacterium]
MLDAIKNLLGLDEAAGRPRERRSRERDIALATSALLVEAAMMDGEFTTDERRAIAAILQDRFDYSAADAVALIEESIAKREATSDIYRFTRAVKDRFDEAGRIEIVENLWHVAYADNVLHDYEAHLVRRVAGLLYVPDTESGAARKRVLARLGIAE